MTRQKFTAVSIALETINAASVREKSIRPSDRLALHLKGRPQLAISNGTRSEATSWGDECRE